MQMKKLLLGLALMQVAVLCAEDFVATSPDGSLKATVSLTDGKLSYSVSRDGRMLVSKSPLGLKLSTSNLTESLELVEVDSGTVDDSYILPVGKRSQLRHSGRSVPSQRQRRTLQILHG